MTNQSDSTSRNQLLDELKSALDEWHTKETKRVDDEIAFMKSVLRGRTGSERLQRSNTAAARVLVVDDITSFLSGT